jgi:branched-chain amino acid aminotransferase
MGVVVVINGSTHAAEEARISVFDRGLLFGDSVFETLGTYGGVPFALAEHLRRLRHSAELVFIELPLSDAELGREVKAAVQRAGNAESYVRIIVTRGSGELGLDPALALDPQRIVIVTPLDRPKPATYEHGATAITVRTHRPTDTAGVVGGKVGNYLGAVLAMRKARAMSANEALIVDQDGNVIEGATSNLFWVGQARLWTPPESAGILAGITRAVVIATALELNLPVSYGCPKAHQLYDVEELFITSSIRQMLSIVAVDGKPIGDGRPGPLYRRLFERFRLVVQRPSED